MATLAAGGRITTELVEEEIERMHRQWRPEAGERGNSLPTGLINGATLDAFDRMQLEAVGQRVPDRQIALRCRPQTLCGV